MDGMGTCFSSIGMMSWENLGNGSYLDNNHTLFTVKHGTLDGVGVYCALGVDIQTRQSATTSPTISPFFESQFCALICPVKGTTDWFRKAEGSKLKTFDSR